ncbi:TPA-induced transmembrane protein [Acomys russatus]|uniref:TPA-induced transmembrane protein n=1 Tax=Acomys russatus TaxID=60746 RepID=UPI0021E1ECC9|nr:TPA-induced transmembrane protein [Acomys russatus]
MEGSRSLSSREDIELSMLEGQAEERAPLNSLQIQPCSAAEDPSPAQMDKESPWSPCNKPVVRNCKLWMVIVTIFLCFTLVIVMSLCLVGVTYIDEDETEILELSSNKTFFIVLKIPEECVNEEELHHLLNKRLTDVYRASPALGRFFTSADIMDFSVENATVTYHLQFGVPAEDDGFIKHMLSKELVLGIMRQNFHDKNLSGCEQLGLDPESLLLYGPPPGDTSELVLRLA